MRKSVNQTPTTTTTTTTTTKTTTTSTTTSTTTETQPNRVKCKAGLTQLQLVDNQFQFQSHNQFQFQFQFQFHCCRYHRLHGAETPSSISTIMMALPRKRKNLNRHQRKQHQAISSSRIILKQLINQNC
ncbi:exocyst complex component 5-like [Drosophila willistoni]|uniref:exocyst complex component 5-like n=1 Tax=Drosophila willistoni TaxID=7260 RepID=UPI001F07E0D5|nr:exocyst complex component 5-like [Drosophila willistoni]